ncbi:MAG: 3-phosphoshikimate 1-carboxyvinyltransferase [Clostridiales bacterium GWF2_38_85]|nr:MAG: 3-phosphoshikimate 1-carboxyvinyltransferase [Clostridiales bacterium GWF2_38_85]
MNIKIQPRKLFGTVQAISSKSDAHRLIIAAALADKATQINLNCISNDIEAAISCISALGGKAERNEQGYLITPISCQKTKKPSLNFGESGTIARFLVPVTSALFDESEFSGSGRLPERPFSPLFEAMRRNGCQFSSENLPVTQKGRLNSGVFELDGNISSQFISGLLIALPLLEGDSEIKLRTKLESSGYVDMTIDTLSKFGVEIEKKDNSYYIKDGQKYRSPSQITVEGDWSNSAFWLAAGAGSIGITVTGLNFDSLQGDKQIETLIARFGANVIRSENSLKVSKRDLHGIEIDASEIPDLVPILAVLGAVSEGETRIKNAARLRHKESDRLMTTTKMLTALGADIAMLEDGLLIKGKPKLQGGIVDSFNDHRIAMATAVAAQFCNNEVTIIDAGAVNKTYPKFFDDYKILGGKADVV